MNSSSRIRLRNTTRYIVSIVALFLTAVVFLTFIIPLIAAFFPGITGWKKISGFKAAEISVPEVFRITVFSLKIALGSTLVALAAGFPAAFFCARRKFLFRKFLLSLSAVPLCIPVLIAALGFVSVFGMSGTLNKIFSDITGLPKSRFLYSQWGIMLAQGFYNFPLVMSIVSRAWESLPSEKENAARLLGAGEGKVFLTVTLPALSPAFASSVIPVFLFCFFSFMMVLLFSAPGVSTLEVEIYQAVKTSLDYETASRLAVAETMTALLITAVYSFITGRLNGSNETGQNFSKKERAALASGDYESPLSKVLEIILFVVLIVFILLFFIGPLAGIVVSGFTARIDGKNVLSLNQYRTLFKSAGFRDAFFTTFKVSLCTASVCTVISFVYALSVQNIENRKVRSIFELSALLPMAVSSVVLGFGITLVFKKGNVWSLVLVQSALFWPLGYRQISAAMQKIPKDVMNALNLMSASPVDGVFRVILPWVKNSVFAAFGFCFAFSAGDTTLPLILSIPKFQTLSLYTYRLSGSYRFNTACSSGTILALICFIVFAVSEKLGKKKMKLRNGGLL